VDTTITTLEFCAGYGGIGLGLKNIFGERMRTIAYCELEGYAQANLLSKMEKGLMDVAPLWNDLKTFPYESFHGLVDILIAGYPCQPFSSAGKRAGKEDPRHLWPWIADGIRLLQPRMCFFENVEGHISLGLSTVISDLEELGYKSSFGIFSASEVGAVHQRKRVFIMAHNKSQSSGGLCERTQTQESKFGFNCEARIGIWPSRPGQQQYAWEPPRVVGSVPAKLANSCSRDSQSGGDSAQAGSESVSSWGQSEDAMFDCGSSIRGGDQGDESTTRVVGNAASKRSCGGSEDGANQQSEMLGERYEAMGNAADARWINCHSQNYGTQESGKGLVDHREICVSETQPPLGRDAHGPAGGMDLSELSGISHQELAEICEWMVKTESRTDELRLLGNGVVPATATRAFLTLIEELNK
jgi:DNA (cytosine-5)-methyltransferase 1